MNRMMPLPGKVQVEGDVHQPLPHESAFEHVSGRAVYIDDMLEPAGTLHGYFGLSPIAKGTLKQLDLTKVREAEGVIDVLTHEDIPGSKFNNPTGKLDDPYLVEETIDFLGQALFFVVAETREQARDASMLAVVEASEEVPARTVDEALAADYPMVTEPLTLKIGDSGEALSVATNRLQGSIEIGGQDHFYLEGHIASAMPGEGQDVTVFSSTQHPSEVQHMVAHALHVSSANVTVEVRRMGGGFGGKETQSNAFAVLAAIAAKKLNRPVKVRPDRDDDMIMTGKRHDFKVDYYVAFDDRGVIEGFEADLAARCGFSADLSGPVTDRALFHIDNCYYLPNTKVSSKPLKTNTVSNTAFRGFGGPQGLVAGERVLEEIAYKLGVDPLEIRKRNFYRDNCDVTPYHQKVEDNIIARLVEELEVSSDYQKRREAILEFNKANRVLKKGIALSPVKFGISFTATWYNQAGALIHVYQDGSVQLNHGGTEMGQGLYTKVAQVVANAFQIDVSKIRVTATTTGKVPNTSATAASSGADLNTMAALNAAEKIKARLVAFATEKYGVSEASVSFLPGMVKIGETTLSFAELVHEAYMARVQLSDTGFYKTPDIHWDRASGKGRPFYYFAYGAAASEVMIDTLTGEHQVMRTDVLHDVGKSLNPALDKGQVEGAFVQGMGWLTTEELWWDEKGALKTHAPSTYKIPLASDVPPIFNVELASWSENPERTIKRSKAVGEPPFCLAYSVLEALSMAVASVADYRHCPRLDAPATPERVLMAVERMKAAS